MRDDLADDRRDGIAVAENAALDLDTLDALLDQHLVVVAARELDRRGQLVCVRHLRDPDRGAEARGLHEHRVRKGVLGRIAVAEGDVPRNGDSAIAQDGLEQVLVHAERRRRHACPDVRHAGQFEEALHGSVLTEGTVEDREHDVDLSQRRCGCRARHDGSVSMLVSGSSPAPEASSQRPLRSISTTTVS